MNCIQITFEDNLNIVHLRVTLEELICYVHTYTKKRSCSNDTWGTEMDQVRKHP